MVSDTYHHSIPIMRSRQDSHCSSWDDDPSALSCRGEPAHDRLTPVCMYAYVCMHVCIYIYVYIYICIYIVYYSVVYFIQVLNLNICWTMRLNYQHLMGFTLHSDLELEADVTFEADSTRQMISYCYGGYKSNLVGGLNPSEKY